jgi:hypothetical protein
MKLHDLTERSVPELRYLVRQGMLGVRSRIARFVPSSGGGPEEARQQLLEQRRFLRRLLTDHPRWALGHARLGFIEVSLQALSDSPIPPRSLATIRVSAQAVRALLGGPAGPYGDRGRALLEADFLDAMLELYRKDYAAALLIFERLLEPASSVQLPATIYFAALEHAGSLALLLERPDDARRYLALLPEHVRSGAAKTSMEFLEKH